MPDPTPDPTPEQDPGHDRLRDAFTRPSRRQAVVAVLLAARDAFDDMIDGLTFGVAAGTAYAAFETVIVYSSVFTAQDFRTEQGIGSWLVVVLNVMVIKSLIYGTATGIAVAAFSGKGEGYDGFTAFYLKNFAFAAGMNVLYWLGVRLLSYLPFGQMLDDMATTDVHPPLHHTLLWITVRIFGTSELAVRLPSLLAGVALVPVLYWVGRVVYDRRTGWVAAMLAAISDRVQKQG